MSGQVKAYTGQYTPISFMHLVQSSVRFRSASAFRCTTVCVPHLSHRSGSGLSSR